MCFARGPKAGTFSASAIDSSKKPPSHLWTLNACWRGCKLDQPDRNYIQAWKQYSCSFFQEQCSKKGRILRVLPLPNGDGHVCRESTSCLPKPPYFFKSVPWRPEQWEDSLKTHLSTTWCPMFWELIEQGVSPWGAYEHVEMYVNWQRLCHSRSTIDHFLPKDPRSSAWISHH